MSETLSRPLAARVAGLPDPREPLDNLPIPAAVIGAAVKALEAGHTHYTDRPGILALRKWVAEYLEEQFKVSLKPDDVTITCGATEARFVVIKQLVKAGERIICPGDPSSIAGAAHLVGAQEVTPQLLDLKTIRLIYLTTLDERGGVSSLLKLAEKHGWWIIYDVADPVRKETFHPAQNSALAPKVITIGSLSNVMPGWRVGWMAGSEMANKLRAYKQSMTICTTSVSQWAGVGAVES